jgi:ribosome-binding protein aMBF1 (putative translation factor)
MSESGATVILTDEDLTPDEQRRLRQLRQAGTSTEYSAAVVAIKAAVADRRRPALAKALRDARLAKGWLQYEAAQHLGIASASLSGIEQGYSRPGLRTISRFANIYGLSLDELVALRERSPVRGGSHV